VTKKEKSCNIDPGQILLAFAASAKGAKLHDRVVRGEKLSEKEHFHEGDDHDADYDHEAFLGRDEAHEFDQLSPGESPMKASALGFRVKKR
jgi:hypothetical protein